MGKFSASGKFKALQDYCFKLGVVWQGSQEAFIDEVLTWIGLMQDCGDPVLEKTGDALYAFYVDGIPATEAGPQQVHWGRQNFYHFLLGRVLQEKGIIPHREVRLAQEEALRATVEGRRVPR